MAYFVNPSRKVQCFVNGVDYSDTFVQFSCTDDSANRNGIVTTTGQVIIGDNDSRDLQAGYRRTQFKRGQPFILNVMGDGGSWIRHPRGTLLVSGAQYNIENSQLELEVGCVLAQAIFTDDRKAYNLVRGYSPYILPPDRRTWQNVGAALAASGRFIYQTNTGGISAASYFGHTNTGAVSVLGVTTLSAKMITGASPIPDSVQISYEYPVIEKEEEDTVNGFDIGGGELNDPCTGESGCGLGLICGNGKCVPDPENGACNRDPDCPLGYICVNGACSPDPRNKCKINYDCRFRLEGKDCVNGYCGTSLGGGPCLFDSQCDEGFFCNDEYTCETRYPECRHDADCPANFICTDKECNPDPTGLACNSDVECGSDERYSCIGNVCENTEGDECTPAKPCESGYYCDYGDCKPIDDDGGDDDDVPGGDPADGKVTRVATESSYTTSYPAIVFVRKPPSDDPNLSRIKRLEQKQKELAKITGCGNTPEEPDDQGPTSCSDDYETKRTNVTVAVKRRSETITEYKGPGYAVSRREDYEHGPAFEVNRQYFGDKYAYCRATWATGCQPNGNCEMEGQEEILTSKAITSNFYDKEGTLVRIVREDYQTMLSVAKPSDWRAGIKNGIPQGFQGDLSTELFLARQVTTTYQFTLNQTTVTTTSWTSKALEAGSGLSAGDIDARRGIQRVDIEQSFGKNLNPPIEDESVGDDDIPLAGDPDFTDPDGKPPFDPYNPATWPRVPVAPGDPPFDPNDSSTWPPKRQGFDEDDPATWPGPDRDEEGNPVGYDPAANPRYTTTFLSGTVTQIVGAGGGVVGGSTSAAIGAGGESVGGSSIIIREQLPVPLYGLEKKARTQIASIYAKYCANWEKGTALGVQVTEFLRQEFLTHYKPGAKFYYADPAADMVLQLRFDGTTWVVNSTECTFTTDGIFNGISNGTVSIPDNTTLS